MQFFTLLADVEPSEFDYLIAYGIIAFALYRGLPKMGRALSGNTVVKGAVKHGAINIIKRMMK